MKALYSLEGNRQKLDGGAMFGNAPKAVWENWVTVDDKNRIDLACRCLLVQETDESGQRRNILFELGIGGFFEPKLKERFGIVDEGHRLLHSLYQIGLEHTDIDVLVLSHLHFDHIGGLLSEWNEGEELYALFPNAEILVSKRAWERALNPHSRDRASFIPVLINALKERDIIHLVDSEYHPLLGPDYRFHFSDGHTPGMMLTEISMPDGPILFCADLIPGSAWVHLPITMGYDRFPEKLIDEKQALYHEILASQARLFFTHDSEVAVGLLILNDKGKYAVTNEVASLKGLIS